MKSDWIRCLPTQSGAEATSSSGPIRPTWTTNYGHTVVLRWNTPSTWSIVVPVSRPEGFHRFSFNLFMTVHDSELPPVLLAGLPAKWPKVREVGVLHLTVDPV